MPTLLSLTYDESQVECLIQLQSFQLKACQWNLKVFQELHQVTLKHLHLAMLAQGGNTYDHHEELVDCPLLLKNSWNHFLHWAHLVCQSITWQCCGSFSSLWALFKFCFLLQLWENTGTNFLHTPHALVIRVSFVIEFSTARFGLWLKQESLVHFMLLLTVLNMLEPLSFVIQVCFVGSKFYDSSVSSKVSVIFLPVCSCSKWRVCKNLVFSPHLFPTKWIM